MAAVVGALRADLETNVATFKADMGAAGDAVDKTTKRMTRAASETDKHTKAIQNFGKELKGAFAVAGGVAVAAFIKDAIQGAIATEEMADTLKHEFGAMGGSVEDWAERTAKELGRVDDELKNSVINFGKLFEKVVPTQGAAADMSEAMTKLAVDLATFNRVPIDEATDKLTKGLAGSTKGLKEFGILISEAEIKQRAVEMGLAATTKEVSAQDKVLASYNLILEKTANVQGFAAKQTETTAGKLRAFQAGIDSLADDLGAILLPVFMEVVKWLDLYASGIRTILGDTEDFQRGIAVLQAQITGGNVVDAVRKFNEAHQSIDGMARAAKTNGGIIDSEFTDNAKSAEELGRAARSAANDVREAFNAVRDFGIPDLPVSIKSMQDVSDAFVKLTGNLSDQIDTLKQKTDATEAEKEAIVQLQQALDGVQEKYDLARKAAEALFMREGDLAKLRNEADTSGINDAAAGLARAGGAMGVSTQQQQQLLSIEQDLAQERRKAAVDLAEMERARAEAILKNDDMQQVRLDALIAAQTIYGDMLDQTTAKQIAAQAQLQASVDDWQSSTEQATGDFFKDLRDTAGSNGKEIAASLITSISDEVLERKAAELADGLFSILFGDQEKKQDVQTINAQTLNVANQPGAGGLPPIPGMGGGEGGGGGFLDWATKAVTNFAASTFGGFFADGGTLSPGQWGVAGENGPEILKGGRHGLQVDNGEMGTTGDVTQNFVFPNANVDGFFQSKRQVAQMARRQLAR